MTAKRRLWLAGVALLLLGAAEAPKPAPPLPPVEAARQGRQLVAWLLSQKPARNLTRTGTMTIRPRREQGREIPMTFKLVATETNWSSIYETTGPESGAGNVKLTVVHADAQPNQYLLDRRGKQDTLAGNEAMTPFAGSDFWVADLGLEFLHWPEQRVLRKELRRGQSCDVLESVNPNPGAGGYSRVVSWIDIDSGGIIYAEAYDAGGKLLKEFTPKSVKKVQGEWQLQEMEMENRQTGSRTSIRFDLASD
jgi:Outer membrane lipoprotein-sorting protein